MALDRLDHIGIAVRDIEKSIPLFEKLLGISCYKTELVEDQGVLTAFFKLGEIKLELVSSTETNNSLANYLDKRGEGLHHLAFQVEDLENEIDQLEIKGFKKIGHEPSSGADQKWIQFIHPESTNRVLVEICQDKV